MAQVVQVNPFDIDQYEYTIEGEANNFLFIYVHGRPLGWHFMQFMDTRAEAQVLAWRVVHVLGCFFHVRGPFIPNDSFEVVKHLLNCIRPRLLQILGLEFLIFAYHSIMGAFGHHGKIDAYEDIILPLIVQFEGQNEPKYRSGHSSICLRVTTLILWDTHFSTTEKLIKCFT